MQAHWTALERAREPAEKFSASDPCAAFPFNAPAGPRIDVEIVEIILAGNPDQAEHAGQGEQSSTIGRITPFRVFSAFPVKPDNGRK